MSEAYLQISWGLPLSQQNSNYEISRHGSTTKEGINKLFHESKENCQWDGEKFVPKPLSLSRINLAKLRDTQSLIEDRKVSVTLVRFMIFFSFFFFLTFFMQRCMHISLFRNVFLLSFFGGIRGF